jgi:ankyrin repeat protein
MKTSAVTILLVVLLFEGLLFANTETRNNNSRLVLDESNNVLSANTIPNAKIKSQVLLDEQLISALEKGDVNTIQAALKGGANPNWVSDTKVPFTVIGWWLLRSSFSMDENGESQCLEVLHTLFGAGAKFQPQYDNKVLFHPIANGCSRVMELLINKGADPNTKIDGASLVELAESYGKDEVVSVLIKHGASPISRKEAAQLRLVQCAAYGDFIGYQKALDNGASIRDRSKVSGQTALIAVTATSSFSGESYAIVKDLLAKGANPNESGGEWGSPLHNLMYYTSVILQDKYANSPRLRSERIAASEMINMLLKAGAYVSGRNKNEQTPLHIASEWNNLCGAKKLIEAGAKIMDRDGEGKTPLDYAKSAEMIKLLKDAGAKERE